MVIGRRRRGHPGALGITAKVIPNLSEKELSCLREVSKGRKVDEEEIKQKLIELKCVEILLGGTKVTALGKTILAKNFTD